MFKHNSTDPIPLAKWSSLPLSPESRFVLYLPLKAGEALFLSWKSNPLKGEKTGNQFETLSEKDKRLRVKFFLDQKFSQKESSQLLKANDLRIGEDFQASASIGGWYRLELVTPGHEQVLLKPEVTSAAESGR